MTVFSLYCPVRKNASAGPCLSYLRPVLHETSHKSEANCFLFVTLGVIFLNIKALKSYICSLKAMIWRWIPNASFDKLLCDLFSGPQQPNYGHWVMSEHTNSGTNICTVYSCLSQSYRKYKLLTNQEINGYIYEINMYIYCLQQEVFRYFSWK